MSGCERHNKRIEFASVARRTRKSPALARGSFAALCALGEESAEEYVRSMNANLRSGRGALLSIRHCRIRRRVDTRQNSHGDLQDKRVR
jgi:hypothetical protein